MVLVVRALGVLALLSPFLAPGLPVSAHGPAALTLDALRNAEYSCFLTANGKAQLIDGEYRESIPGWDGEIVVRLTDLVAFGDLDGDGAEDAAVVLTSTGGGSGTFFDLVAVLNRDGHAVPSADAALGDRVELRSLVIERGRAIVQLVTQGPEDGFCCPTLKVRNTYALQGQDWDELSSEDQGTVSVTDLEGVTWRLKAIDEGAPAMAAPPVTATFANGQVAGSGGCNRYSAAVRPGEAQRVTIGAPTSTRMACAGPILAQEAEYFNALPFVTQWGFQDGKMVLFAAQTLSDTTRLRTMTFAAEPGP